MGEEAPAATDLLRTCTMAAEDVGSETLISFFPEPLAPPDLSTIISPEPSVTLASTLVF
jgi:hypothetical protein